ncbi:MAG: DUF4406 domain-containing protein [Treponema sp.]|nr:DUF4406 domain-containing protein [Treponema sp.]
MKNIYICGPVSGRPLKEVEEHFNKNEERIRKTSKENNLLILTANPIKLCRSDDEWHQAMRTCIRALTNCDGIALLQGWEFSKGAKTELWIARQLQIPVVYIEPPAGPDDLSGLIISAPETLRYFEARLGRFGHDVDNALAADRAAFELANRYLDPYGFEYIEIKEGD